MRLFEFVYLIAGLIAFGAAFHGNLPNPLYWLGYPSLAWTVLSIVLLAVVGPWWLVRRAKGETTQDWSTFPYASRALRVVFGFACVQIIAVATGAIAMTGYFAIVGADPIWNWDGRKSTLADLAISAGHAAAPATLLAVVCVASPLYLVSRRQGWNSLRFYLAAGVAISLALVVPMMVQYPDILTHDAFNGRSFLLAVMLAGPLSALAFWLVVRPDRARGPVQRG